MFYIKMYSFILQDKTLTMKEKIVMSFFISKWESKPIPEPPKQKDRHIEIVMFHMSNDLGMDRRNLYKIIDSLKEKKYILYIQDSILNKRYIYIRYENPVFDEYYQTSRIIGELNQKWNKKK